MLITRYLRTQSETKISWSEWFWTLVHTNCFNRTQLGTKVSFRRKGSCLDPNPTCGLFVLMTSSHNGAIANDTKKVCAVWPLWSKPGGPQGTRVLIKWGYRRPLFGRGKQTRYPLPPLVPVSVVHPALPAYRPWATYEWQLEGSQEVRPPLSEASSKWPIFPQFVKTPNWRYALPCSAFTPCSAAPIACAHSASLSLLTSCR